MPVRGIFLKIYLCFWLSSLLVIAAQIGLDWVSRTGPFGGGFHDDRIRRTVGPVLIFYGHTVTEHMRSSDHEVLERSAQRLKNLSGIDAYVVDGAGRDLRGRSLPRSIEDIAGAARRTGKAEFSSSRTRVLLALPMVGEDGKSYTVVGDIPQSVFAPPPPPGHGPPPPMIFGPGFFFPPGQPLSLLRLFMTLLVSGGACYLLARYLTSPIVKLREAARRFADGELSARSGRKKTLWKDELSDLAHDFDMMAERIESLVIQQRRLVQDVSHELRSPLARLTIAVELLRRQGDAAAPSTLTRIEKEAMALNEMIGQVLELTRMEGNVSSVDTAPVDLALLLGEIVDDAHFEANGRGRGVRLLESEPCVVTGNEEWLRRGIENVIRNAVRYTFDNTVVEVRLTRYLEAGVEYARISVRDHGGGVPEADLPHLFRPFYRVSAARDRQSGGTGLGLAITKSAVALHRGSVTARNAADGGLLVNIDLPAGEDATTTGVASP
jgi:two-component system sensor histidine kinase CpxA